MGVSTQSTWESMFSVADHENENVTDSGTTPARRHLVWSNEQVEKGSQIVAILAASPGGSQPDALECLVINFLKGLTETVDSFFNNINNLLTNIPHHQLFPLLDRVIIHLSQQDVQYSTRDEVYRVALVDQRKHLADTFKPVFESDSCFKHGNTLHQQYYEALVTFRASLADVWRLSASCQATHDLAIETWNRERSSHSETCHAEMVRK